MAINSENILEYSRPPRTTFRLGGHAWIALSCLAGYPIIEACHHAYFLMDPAYFERSLHGALEFSRRFTLSATFPMASVVFGISGFVRTLRRRLAAASVPLLASGVGWLELIAVWDSLKVRELS